MLRSWFDRSGSIKGRLEGYTDGQIHGWALRGGHPEERQRVTLIGEPASRVTIMADRYRADLHKAGFGDGHYGFSVPLHALGDVESIRACAGSFGAALAGSPILIEPDRLQPSLPCSGLPFRLDRPLKKGTLTGWVVDAKDPTRRVELTLRQHGRLVTQARATRFRSDIDIAGADALHGFSLAWTGRLSGFGELVDSTRDIVLAKIKFGP